jgi:hypothetical protein
MTAAARADMVGIVENVLPLDDGELGLLAGTVTRLGRPFLRRLRRATLFARVSEQLPIAGRELALELRQQL